MKTRVWIVIFAAFIAVCLPLAFILGRLGGGHIANIYRDGKCICSIDLDSVTEGYSMTLDDGEGHINTIRIEPGSICVEDANCPDRVCVNTGRITGGSKPIICMPAKLVIRLESRPAEGFDAETGG